jgi:hypothetical protein
MSDIIENLPLTSKKIPQEGLAGRFTSGSRSYNFSYSITDLAAGKFRKIGRGIIYKDLMDAGLVIHKDQAQEVLKYQLRKGNLFTLGDKRPQEYYPTKIKSEIIEKLSKRNTPIQPSEVSSIILPDNSSISPLSQCLQYVTIQTLEGYVLPLLAEAPVFVHNMQFKTKVPSEYYDQIKLPYYKRNNGKHHQEIIGSTLADYVIYKSGTVDIQTTCSNNPYKLETEEDRFRIIEFFGQIRAGLIDLLHDRHERIVSDVLEWELNECDINKDIKVTDLLHFSGVKIQVKHLDHLFRIYIKALGKDTVCRVEENKQPKKCAIEFINDVFNPTEKIEKQLSGISESLDKLASFQGSPDDDNCDLTVGHNFCRQAKVLKEVKKGRVDQSSQDEPNYPDREVANPGHESTGACNG